MNQILFVPDNYQQKSINVTKKVRKRKRLFIFPIMFSLVIAISSYKIYATVSNMQDIKNNQDIQTSQIQIQNKEVQKNNETNNITQNQENKLVIQEENTANNEVKKDTKVVTSSNKEKSKTATYKASNGKNYKVIATLNIPSLGIEYPVLSSTSEALLKISLNKYWGANPNEVGNMCIVGHNYEDSRFFGKLNKIKKGAIVKITDLDKKTLDYEVYDTYVVGPYDTDCTSQLTNGKTEITLITCHNNGTKRFVVKARAKI